MARRKVTKPQWCVLVTMNDRGTHSFASLNAKQVTLTVLRRDGLVHHTGGGIRYGWRITDKGRRVVEAGGWLT